MAVKAAQFLKSLYIEIKKDDVFSLAGEMSYKTLLALFPFALFLTELLALLQLDGAVLQAFAETIVSPRFTDLLFSFADSQKEYASGTILSVSLLVSIFSSSSGFRAVIKGINKSYGIKESRPFIKKTLISVCLTLLFSGAVVLSLIVLIFGDAIKKFLFKITPASADMSFAADVVHIALYIAVLGLTALTVMFVYKLSLDKKCKFSQLYIGALIAVGLWLLACKGFNLYINNFSRFGKVYGAIGSIFILILWINMTGVILLIGSEINALLAHDKSGD